MANSVCPECGSEGYALENRPFSCRPCFFARSYAALKEARRVVLTARAHALLAIYEAYSKTGFLLPRPEVIAEMLERLEMKTLKKQRPFKPQIRDDEFWMYVRSRLRTDYPLRRRGRPRGIDRNKLRSSVEAASSWVRHERERLRERVELLPKRARRGERKKLANKAATCLIQALTKAGEEVNGPAEMALRIGRLLLSKKRPRGVAICMVHALKGYEETTIRLYTAAPPTR